MRQRLSKIDALRRDPACRLGADARHKLKIALTTLAPFIGGAEVAAERLALGLQASGHEVIVIVGTRGAMLERLAQQGLRCVFAPMCLTDKWHWWKYYKARQGLQNLLRREQPNIVHSNDLPTHQMTSDAARRLHIPRICHHRFPFPGAAIDWFNKYGAERHLFVSRALMMEMCTNSARLTAYRRLVVYDGLPLPSQPGQNERRQARYQLKLPVEKMIVTFAGQVSEHKGVADLLRAWSLLDANLRQHAELVIVGEDLQGAGKYREAMQQLSGQLQCEARFVGFQRNIGSWLCASDIAVVPSHLEPLGNATLEAMSYALPAIGSAVGGIPEMIVHEHTGLLVPPRNPEKLAQAMALLLTAEDMRTHYGFQARQRCEELFSLEVHVHNILQEYYAIAGCG